MTKIIAKLPFLPKKIYFCGVVSNTLYSEMKKIILFTLLPLLFSCGVSDERIDAYERAEKKVRKASSSESLELIAYDLSKELYEIDANEELSLAQIRILAATDEGYKEILDAIVEARAAFDEALSDKETLFYLERLSDKEKDTK